MTHSALSFDILGQVAPILTWTEGDNGVQLPDAWTTESVPFEQRERGWLLYELPTYSYDNVDDILHGARADHQGAKRVGTPFGTGSQRKRPSLSPPEGYDLLQAFRKLNQHFFIWNGTEPCVREGAMEDLHELAIRMPAGHILRHTHARVVSEGVLEFEKALELPELVTLLPSNSFGLRGVVRRGMSESHLHMNGVISAEETWANSLLRPLSSQGLRGATPAEKRLLTLNLFAGRLLAVAIWHSFTHDSRRLAVRPQKLLDLLDEIYFARDEAREKEATYWLSRAIQQAVYGTRDEEKHFFGKDIDDSKLASRRQALQEALDHLDELEREMQKPGEGEDEEEREKAQRRKKDEWKLQKERVKERRAAYEEILAKRSEHLRSRALVNQPVPKEYGFLLRWMAPTAHHISGLGKNSLLPGSLPETVFSRYEFVNRLHLAAHLRLVQLSSRDDGRDRVHEPRVEREKERLEREGKPRPGVDPKRHFLHEALFRYIVCRTHHWQQATQQGRSTGLRRFKDFWDSSERHIEGLSKIQRAELTFGRLRQWRGLRVLEGRVGPPDRAQDIVPWILAHARPEDRRIEKFGLVVHFKKLEERFEERGFTDLIRRPVPRLRWGKRRRVVQSESVRLYRLLRRPTPVVPFVVGIDACNLELATPPEVFAPAFRFLRELPIPLQGEAKRFSPYVQLENDIRKLVEKRRLGMTYHVGEDFRHLLSGLRAICEVVDFLKPHPGDRLGHGTALALDPKHWLEQNGYQAVMPKLEWLDTLVWVHHFLGPGDELVGELAIEDKIQRLGWEIYSRAIAEDFDPLSLTLDRQQSREKDRAGHSLLRRGLLDWNWAPLTLWDSWCLRQIDPYSVDMTRLFKGELRLRREPRGVSEEERRWRSVQERVIRECRDQIGSRNAFLLLGLYWLSSDVREEGRKVTVVDMKPQKELWLELCQRVEDRMKDRIHDRELVVEVNPSANRIIGPMARYDQHHVFHLTLDENKRLSRKVRVSINTDNPAVCNTTLAHEHYLLGEILIRQGVPEAEVVSWLDWLRENGNDYNFVRRLKTIDESPAMRRLVEWLRSIRPSVREQTTRDKKLEAFWEWQRRTRLRSLGFKDELIEFAPKGLERLLALEATTRKLGLELWQARNHLAEVRGEELVRLEREFEVLRAELVRAAEASETAGGRQFASRLGGLLKNPDTASNRR